jgi:hypothetical protein
MAMERAVTHSIECRPNNNLYFRFIVLRVILIKLRIHYFYIKQKVY